MSQLLKKTLVGDCECCTSVNVEIFQMHGNMLMCSECRDKEIALARINDQLEASRAIDASIQSKNQIFTAPTIPSIELKNLIQQNDSIPSNQKDFEYAREIATRFKHAQQVLFEKRKETLEQEKQVRDLQGEVQVAIGKLRGDLKAQFKELDINYQPIAPKTVKSPRVPSTSSNSVASRKEVNDAAIKHGVLAAGVKFTMVAQNLSPESAAIFLKNQIAAGKARTAARLEAESKKTEENN